jgi:hypothetical protein
MLHYILPLFGAFRFRSGVVRLLARLVSKLPLRLIAMLLAMPLKVGGFVLNMRLYINEQERCNIGFKVVMLACQLFYMSIVTVAILGMKLQMLLVGLPSMIGSLALTLMRFANINLRPLTMW